MDLLFCLLIKIANFAMAALMGWWVDALIFFLEFLPDSPIQIQPIEWGIFGNAVGYFIPVQTMASHFALFIVAYLIWFGLQHILRILKMVR